LSQSEQHKPTQQLPNDKFLKNSFKNDEVLYETFMSILITWEDYVGIENYTTRNFQFPSKAAPFPLKLQENASKISPTVIFYSTTAAPHLSGFLLLLMYFSLLYLVLASFIHRTEYLVASI
jgi:hypothetical protein